MIRGALRLEHRIKAVRELAISVANQKAHRLRSRAEGPCDLPRLLRHPLGVGMRRASGDVHPAARQFDEEQHLQSLEPDGVHGKEINRDHTRRLRAEELAPRGPPSRSGRPELLLTQDLLDGGRRHGDAETLQFTNDTLIAPTRIFASEPKDQRSHLPVDGRPTGLSIVRPPFRNESAMPTEQRGGRDEKDSPLRSWQRPSGCRQEATGALFYAVRISAPYRPSGSCVRCRQFA